VTHEEEKRGDHPRWDRVTHRPRACRPSSPPADQVTHHAQLAYHTEPKRICGRLLRAAFSCASRYNTRMKYSLGSLMVVVALAPPGLAFLWWLRHTWLVQVWMMLALMVAILCTGCWLLSTLIAATQRLARSLSTFSARAPNRPKN
jgi:hypothetical protein